MSRPLRIEFEGAFYHVLSRGQRSENIFYSDKDRKKFLEKLEECVEKFKITIHAYVLMDNHYHLLIETPFANLSKAMHYINASYSNWFKTKHQLVGSIFQGRFKSILVQKDSYLKILSAYIHLNPVRAGIANRPGGYTWSSHRYYMQKNKKPQWLYVDDIMSEFSYNPEHYQSFIMMWYESNKEIKRESVYGKNSFLGSEKYYKKVINNVRSRLEKMNERELPELKRLKRLSAEEIKSIILKLFKISEEDLFIKKPGKRLYRKLYIYGLKRYTSLSLREIGELVGLDYSSVSQTNRRFVNDLDSGKKAATQQVADRLRKELEKSGYIGPF